MEQRPYIIVEALSDISLSKVLVPIAEMPYKASTITAHSNAHAPQTPPMKSPPRGQSMISMSFPQQGGIRSPFFSITYLLQVWQ
jgi:hypothetical protein